MTISQSCPGCRITRQRQPLWSPTRMVMASTMTMAITSFLLASLTHAATMDRYITPPSSSPYHHRHHPDSNTFSSSSSYDDSLLMTKEVEDRYDRVIPPYRPKEEKEDGEEASYRRHKGFFSPHHDNDTPSRRAASSNCDDRPPLSWRGEPSSEDRTGDDVPSSSSSSILSSGRLRPRGGSSTEDYHPRTMPTRTATKEEEESTIQSVIHTQVHHDHHHQGMLYVDCMVNERPMRACIDTGASTTVMSLEKAKQCGLLSHVDTSVGGGIKGVGFAKILGMVHDAKIRLGRVQIRTRVSIIESLTPPLVIGLDVLRHCQCDVSFKKNQLVLRNNDNGNGPIEEVVPFCVVNKQDHSHPSREEEDDDSGGSSGGGNVSMAGV